jgi:hypothetical protein
MKKKSQKLLLSRETLQYLQDSDSRKAAGGAEQVLTASCQSQCMGAIC